VADVETQPLPTRDLPEAVWKDHLLPLMTWEDARRLGRTCQALWGVVREHFGGDLGTIRVDPGARGQPCFIGGGLPGRRSRAAIASLGHIFPITCGCAKEPQLAALGLVRQLPALTTLDFQLSRGDFDDLVHWPPFIPPSLKAFRTNGSHCEIHASESFLRALAEVLSTSRARPDRLEIKLPTTVANHPVGDGLVRAAQALHFCSPTLKGFLLAKYIDVRENNREQDYVNPRELVRVQWANVLAGVSACRELDTLVLDTLVLLAKVDYCPWPNEVDTGYELGGAVGKLRRLKDLALMLSKDGRVYQALRQGLAASGGDYPLPLLWRVGVFSAVQANADLLTSLILPSVRVFTSCCSDSRAALLRACALRQVGYKHILIPGGQSVYLERFTRAIVPCTVGDAAFQMSSLWWSDVVVGWKSLLDSE
jgi:hypothetical protein